MAKSNNDSWQKIFDDLKVLEHDFKNAPFLLSAKQINTSCQDFKKPSQKEARILCKHDTREDRPNLFIVHGLFILPVKNGNYAIFKGEGYIDIPEVESDIVNYNSSLDFELDTSKVGNSEMQHLDFAYASSLIRTFMNDPSLVLTIRGRKYTPSFDFLVDTFKVETSSVQTEVDAGYEGKDKVVLVEAKNSSTKNTIIRQLYYPFKQWQLKTNKKVYTLFFEKSKAGNTYSIWKFEFTDPNNYNSIRLVDSKKFKII
jgi:hypothetical protein